jgi:hypothetical protein
MTTLLDRIRRDQYGPEHDDAHAKGWNAALRHVESLILGTSIDALAPSAASSAGACLDGVNPTVGGSQGPTNSLDLRVKEQLVTP